MIENNCIEALQPMNMWLAKPSSSMTSMGGHGGGGMRQIGLGRLRVATDGSPSTDAASGSTPRFRLFILLPNESRACRLLHHLLLLKRWPQIMIMCQI
ncbi:hypothetical protein ACFX2H_043649 [Malus domestica]